MAPRKSQPPRNAKAKAEAIKARKPFINATDTGKPTTSAGMKTQARVRGALMERNAEKREKNQRGLAEESDSATKRYNNKYASHCMDGTENGAGYGNGFNNNVDISFGFNEMSGFNNGVSRLNGNVDLSLGPYRSGLGGFYENADQKFGFANVGTSGFNDMVNHNFGFDDAGMSNYNNTANYNFEVNDDGTYGLYENTAPEPGFSDDVDYGYDSFSSQGSNYLPSDNEPPPKKHSKQHSQKQWNAHSIPLSTNSYVPVPLSRAQKTGKKPKTLISAKKPPVALTFDVDAEGNRLLGPGHTPFKTPPGTLSDVEVVAAAKIFLVLEGLEKLADM
jgi:hypothetical protein